MLSFVISIFVTKQLFSAVSSATAEGEFRADPVSYHPVKAMRTLLIVGEALKSPLGGSV